MGSDTRERIVGAGAELFRRNGYTGTGVKQIVETANAPFGSLYHFFPGGKEQLGEEVIRWSGAMYLQLIDLFYADMTDPVETVRQFYAAAGETLRETDYADACPIATVALEVASTSEPLRRATADVFESWIDRAEEHLVSAGVPADHARGLATTLLALLEGAFILCRATRSTEPLAFAGETGALAMEAALGR